MGSTDRFTAASADLMCGRKWIISQAAGARRVSAEGLLPSETLERQEVEKIMSSIQVELRCREDAAPL